MDSDNRHAAFLELIELLKQPEVQKEISFTMAAWAVQNGLTEVEEQEG